MKVYILTYYDKYEKTIDVIGCFTSYDKAMEYMNLYINRYGCYEEIDFSIDIQMLDPDSSWMKE